MERISEQFERRVGKLETLVTLYRMAVGLDVLLDDLRVLMAETRAASRARLLEDRFIVPIRSCAHDLLKFRALVEETVDLTSRVGLQLQPLQQALQSVAPTLPVC